jgi:hypothetical protein
MLGVYAQCVIYAECRKNPIMLSVVMLNVIMLSVVMLNVIMLSVVRCNQGCHSQSSYVHSLSKSVLTTNG